MALIRLALVIPTMDRGGAEKQLVMLAANLPRDRFDVRVYLLTRGGPRTAELNAAGVWWRVIGKSFKADPRPWFGLRREFVSWRPDVVHTWLFAANAFGRSAAVSAGVPVVLGSERCVDPWKASWQLAIDRRLAARSAAITTNSTGVVDFYNEHGIASEMFRVIPNGVAASDRPTGDRVAADRAEVLRSFRLDPDRRLLLAVGRLWPQKNYRDLIWSAELLATLRGDVTLAVAGDGPERASLMRHRDAVSTTTAVRFLGRRDDVARLIPHADVFWNGSQYEGQSNAILEAMAAGVPVVASDIAGNRDLVVDEVTGYLVPVGDPATRAKRTRKLLEDAERRTEMGRSSRDRVASEFSVDRMVQRHVGLYEELAGG